MLPWISQIWMIIVSLYAEFSRSVLDPNPEYCLNKIIYCPVTMHVGVCDINLACFRSSLSIYDVIGDTPQIICETMLVWQNNFTHKSIPSKKKYFKFFLAIFSGIALLIWIFASEGRTISIIFWAEHMLPGLSIKWSGKKKTSYMHYLQYPLKMSRSLMHISHVLIHEHKILA